MDRAISPEIKKQRKQKLILQIAVISFFTGIGFYSLMYLFQPGIAAKNIRIYAVDKGPLEISVYAVGKIVSQEEQVITSPVSSKILEVYKKAGEKVTKGEALAKTRSGNHKNRIRNQTGRASNEKKQIGTPESYS